ncbi:MAG: glycosyltransferase [Bryobacteraceae bacterium]|nr:glycosyltransferase [Bryobacteraceae bacterium]
MTGAPRVALFADSLLEVNGVALTCRMIEEHAVRHGLPLLVVHAGPETALRRQGEQARLSLRTSRLHWNLENDLKFDLLFWRHLPLVERSLREFEAEIVHITGPNHPGFLGSLAAWRLGLPVVMSWHTNVHEYAAWRLPRWMPQWIRSAVSRASFLGLALYYRQGRIHLVPNREMALRLERATGKPSRLMMRGVDCRLFNPCKRQREDGAFVAGYVGRLSPEKGVRRLAEAARALMKAGVADFRIEAAGEGSERRWLEREVPNFRWLGMLKGEELARAYANFDVFVFPSETDTYGNAVQEAMASGVPCVVMNAGGPATIVQHGVTGMVCDTAAGLARSVVELAQRPALRAQMGRAARRAAEGRSWDQVAATVWSAWQDAVAGRSRQKAEARCLA